MKNYDKVLKLLGQDTVSEMDNGTSEDLNKVIVSAETAMKYVQDELDKNEEYQRLKDAISALTQGKKDVFKRQKAKIAYALEILGSRGK